jgi:HPt (histidine-containing phosphotransfer) domain-containing protein
MNSKPYDLTFVTDIAKGNKEFIKSLIDVFIVNTPAVVNEMIEAKNAGEWDKVGKLAHKLKSTIDTMGLHTVKELIRFIETNAKTQADLVSIPQKIETLYTVVQDCIIQLKKEEVYQ